MIDCHVHLRDWEQAEKETIFHACTIAADIGVSALFDMPNTAPPLTTADFLEKRIAYGKQEAARTGKKIFYGVYAGVTSDEAQLADVVRFAHSHFPNCVGLKMFAGNSTGNMGLPSEEAQRHVYQTLVKLGYRGVLAVHCEKESLIHSELFRLEKPETHSSARPQEAEVQSINNQINFAQQTGFQGNLHICHVSTKAGIALIQTAKQRGVKISCGATAHHALLNTDAYARLGLLAKMNPPLRDEKNRAAVFEGLLSGMIDTIESDHAPHTLKQKKEGASGIPGFAGTLLLIKALRKAGASEVHLQSLCGKNINAIFGTDFAVNVPPDELIRVAYPLAADLYEFNAFKYTKYAEEIMPPCPCECCGR